MSTAVEGNRPEKDGHSLKIFLAEDNPADVYLLREAFAEAGVEEPDLLVIGDGEKALEFFRDNDERTIGELSLVVLDLNLPKNDGGEILRCIRKHSACPDVPVVVLTSSDSPRDRDTIQQLGANCYITKPSDLDEFIALGRRLLAFASSANTAKAAGT